jgi:ribosome-associated toxin RatA of RatAB toxin-antitoxin module
MAMSATTGLLLAALGPFAPDAVVSVGRTVDGHGAEMRMETVIAAPIDDVYAVVADVAKYPQWFPTLSRVQTHPSGEVDAVFRFPWPLKTMRQRFLISRVRGHDHGAVTWQQLDGDFARNEGAWRLRATADGRTRLAYDAVVQFRRWVPGWLIARAQRRAAAQLMHAVEARAQLRRGRAAVP